MEKDNLGQVECSLSLFDGNGQSRLESIQAAVIRQLEIVDTGHDTREVIIRRVGRLAGATHYGEDGGEILETYRHSC